MDALNQSPTIRRLVPAEKPLSMPEQSLQDWRAGPRPLPRVCGFARFARIFVFGVAAGLTVYATWEMYHVVGQEKATMLQIVLVALFASTFAWIALSAASACLGVIVVLASSRTRPRHTPCAFSSSKTVVVVPIHNEDVAPIFASLTRMMSDLVAHGQSRRFDLFVLSDSTDESILKQERDAVLVLRNLQDEIAVYYRKREGNEGKKAGNIADFVRRWGGAYDFMIVLDADSYMSAEAMLELVRSMEEDPKAALIQTVPRLSNGRTLFARMQQFASEIYSPILTSGLALWHSDEGNYWGHNAVIRVKAFASACGLPSLGGPKPFGGHILSHDFVEAALLRRSGFAVYMRPDIGGSHEGTPPTFADYAVRDRRWAQGNLQHTKVVAAAGLHWVSRVHLLTGIMSYLASPLWLMFLVAGVILSWQAVTYAPDYFPDGYSLFPAWPRFDAARALALLGLSALVLLLPKILALTVTLLDPKIRRAAGGGLLLSLSVLCEILLSALLAPITMLVQTKFVFDILFGRETGWEAPQRQEKDIDLTMIARQHFGHTIAGIALCLGTIMISPQVWLWLSPVWLGLCFAIPIIALTSSRSVGEMSRKLFPTTAAEAEDSHLNTSLSNKHRPAAGNSR